MKKYFAVIVLAFMMVAVNAQRTPVKGTDIPKAITTNIAKDYAGFVIKDATKVVSNSQTNYEVLVTKGTAQETLLYDGNGKFIKKVVAQGGTLAAHKPVAKTPEKKPVQAAPSKK
jgi:hypothetical protein